MPDYSDKRIRDAGPATASDSSGGEKKPETLADISAPKDMRNVGDAELKAMQQKVEQKEQKAIDSLKAEPPPKPRE